MPRQMSSGCLGALSVGERSLGACGVGMSHGGCTRADSGLAVLQDHPHKEEDLRVGLSLAAQSLNPSPRESFRNGKPDGWGESEILIAGHAYERKAPVHPRTGLPLGSACRWERSMLDSFEFPVYAFFKP